MFKVRQTCHNECGGNIHHIRLTSVYTWIVVISKIFLPAVALIVFVLTDTSRPLILWVVVGWLVIPAEQLLWMLTPKRYVCDICWKVIPESTD